MCPWVLVRILSTYCLSVVSDNTEIDCASTLCTDLTIFLLLNSLTFEKCGTTLAQFLVLMYPGNSSSKFGLTSMNLH